MSVLPWTAMKSSAPDEPRRRLNLQPVARVVEQAQQAPSDHGRRLARSKEAQLLSGHLGHEPKRIIDLRV